MTINKALTEMENYISGISQNMTEALEIGKTAIKNFKIEPVNRVVIAGLGGSGISGKIISKLVENTCKVPIHLINDYGIPGWVDKHTLFIAASYSGNTEETLSALNEARSKNAQICSITAGGKLEKICRENGYNTVVIPSGQPPRTSFGYSSVQQFFVLHAYDLISDFFIKEVQDAAQLLKDEAAAIKNEAKAVADKIIHTIPVIYSEAHAEGLAIRLRQQINENAKMLCWHNVLPEMNHNELVGWAGGNETLSALFIHTPDDHPGVKRRMELSKEIIANYTPHLIDLVPKGNTAIARAYYLIHLSDWISFYLAEKQEVDPIEIRVIDYLKNELEKG